MEETKQKPLKSPLPTLVDASLAIEKLRVASEVRQTHLFLNGLKELESEGIITAEQVATFKKNWEKGRSTKDIPQEHRLHDVETDEMVRRLKDIEDYTDGRVACFIKDHPAYPWFSRVRGVGQENIGKVVGPVRVKPEDYLRCPECRHRYDKVTGLTTCPECNLKLEDPPFAVTISGLHKFAGFAPSADGKTMKRVKGGGKLEYNSQLRSMCWRLGSSLLRAKGKFYDYYVKEKDKYYQSYENQGVKIVPATSLPRDNKGKRYEPVGTISEGHVHNQAMRKMIKLFLSGLWVVWREAEGLSVTKPYAIDKLGHNSYIGPWEMTDR